MKSTTLLMLIVAFVASTAMADDTMKFKGKSKGSFAISDITVDPDTSHRIYHFTAADTGNGTLVGRFHSTATASADSTTGESTLPRITLTAADKKSGFHGEFTSADERSPTDVTWEVDLVEGFGRLEGATGQYSVRVQSTASFADLIGIYVTTGEIIEAHYVATFIGTISTPGSTNRQ